MPQRLKMADAFDGRGDGLAVGDAAGVERDVPAEAHADEALQDLQLHRAHELHANFAQAGIPDHAQLRLLLLEQAELRQRQLRVEVGGQTDAVAHHGLQRCAAVRGGIAERIPGQQAAQAECRADVSGRDLLHGFKFRAGIQAQLRDLRLQRLAVRAMAAHGEADGKRAARDLQKRQAIALRVVRDLIDAGRKLRGIDRHGRKMLQRPQQLVDAVKLPRRAEQAGKQLPLCHGLRGQRVVQRTGVQKVLQQGLGAEGDGLGVVQRGAAVAERGARIGQQGGAVCAGQVHFIEEQDDGHAVVLQQPPERQRVALHAVRAADEQQRAVDDGHDALGLRRKIGMARRVEQGDGEMLRFKARLLGKNRDTARPLQLVRVEMGVSAVNTAERAQRAGLVEQRLGKRGLPGVHLSKNAEHEPPLSALLRLHAQHLPVFVESFQISIPQEARLRNCPRFALLKPAAESGILCSSKQQITNTKGDKTMFQLRPYFPPDFSEQRFQNAPDAVCVPAPFDGVAPEHYHAMSIFPEYFKVNGQWLLAEESRMDCVAVYENGRIIVREFRLLRKGDLVFTGRTEDATDGIYVHPNGFREEEKEKETFAFRQNRSRETAFSRDYDELYDLLRYERDHGKIVWVMGPAFAFDHDARAAMAKLIENGYVHAILAGNALATHDLEAAYLKTALGQDIYTQRSVPNGHYHHLDTINRVRYHGSIANFIQNENIHDGIIYSCEKCGVPYVLGGSIRDDGPLPPVYGDVYAAQNAMRDQIRSATTVISMATMLHTIATGNMTPSFRVLPDGTVRQVYFYCVDVSEFVVNKLADRGSLSARGIVTNVQDFVVNLQKGLNL